MRKRRTWIILAVVLALMLAGGYAVYACFLSPASRAQEPTGADLETATVTQGDIVITADGSGELVPAAEVALSFHTAGTVDEVLVEVGDEVQEDDVLAKLETERLERALAEAEVEVQLAQLNLADIQAGPSDAEVSDAATALRAAQVELQLAQDAYENTLDSHLDNAVEQRQIDFDWTVGYYQQKKAEYEAGDLSQSDHDHAMNAMISAEGRLDEAINQAQIEEVQAENRVTQAQNNARQAWENWQILQSEPTTDTLMRATLDVDEALVAREEAENNLQAAQLSAPFGGVILDIAVTEGTQVGADTSILTLADLTEPLLRFWAEESDLGSVIVGNRVEIVFEGLPDVVFVGEVTRVNPELVTVSGRPAVQALASLELGPHADALFSGMTADVEVVAAEARDALLVPVEALRETSPGQYAVFVVQEDGELEMRSVSVGLSDPVNAQILTGLALGEVVSTGEVQ